MSDFIKSVDRFNNRFHLNIFDRIKMIIHYPLFKMAWYKSYGNGFLKEVSNKIFPLLKYYSYRVSTINPLGYSIKIPISFDQSDLESFNEIYLGNEYEAPVPYNDIESYLDLGANTGMAARYFLSQCPIKRAVLVEANPVLANNLLNISDTVCIDNSIVSGTTKDKCDFYVHKNHRMSSLTTPENNDDIVTKKSIECKPLSDILNQYQLSTGVDLLKMDIEGAEHLIAKEDLNIFLKFKHLLIEIHGPNDKRDSFIKNLSSIGLRLVSRRLGNDTCEIAYLNNL